MSVDDSSKYNQDIDYLSEIRIGVTGNVDSGKSTTISVLTNEGTIDNGKGSARKLVMKHNHELESGRTSDISHAFIQRDDKTINFIDLAGHEKYFKTTVRGMNGYSVNMACLLINANTGIQMMTKEHITLILSLKIPFFIIYTKVDITPKNVYERNINNIQKHIESRLKKKYFIVDKDANIEELIKDGQVVYHDNTFVPIFPISNVTGEGLSSLKYYINNIPPIKPDMEIINGPTNLIIDKIYQKHGIGLVVSGVLKSGRIKKGDIKLLGPFHNQFHKIVIKSIHNNFREFIDEVYAGQSCCINIKSASIKVDIKRNQIKRGFRILDINEEKVFQKFSAKVKIMHHPTTITKKYQPTIHCGPVSQAARIVDMDKEFLRSRDEANVIFEFKYRPEYIERGTRFIFREGLTKGFGIILDVMC